MAGDIPGEVPAAGVHLGTEYCLLGPLTVRRGGTELRVPAGQQRVLLAALLLRGGHPASADELSGLLWETGSPASVRLSVQNAVMRLRRTLGDGAAALVTMPEGYLIRIAPGELDVQRFEVAVAAGRTAARAGDWAAADRELRAGLALWRGEPLAGIPSELLAARELPRLAELRLQAAELSIEAQLRLGRPGDVIAGLRQLTAEHPLRERLHGLLMLALHGDGQLAAALAAFQAARDVLISELGTEPGPELRRIHRQLLAGGAAGGIGAGGARGSGPSAAGARADGGRAAGAQAGGTGTGGTGTGGTGGTETGSASAVGTELPAGGPAGSDDSGSGHPEVRFSLPPDTAAFTGRDAELLQLTSAADAAGRTLVIRVIGGMPGVGKTALAVRAAYELRDRFGGRQLFVDLHGHTPGREPLAPADALAGLLTAVGVDPRYLPGSLDDRAAMWRDKTAEQPTLLVLDNAASSAQVLPLLPGGDGGLVLVTSRRQLADLPGPAAGMLLDTLPPGQARQMFLALAPRAAGSPAQVAELAALAGYLPLAISLLARVHSRHSTWSLSDLAAETRQSLLSLTAEHDSVAAAFEVSWRHLAAPERRLFALLGLHPGSEVDLWAANALNSAGPGTAAGPGGTGLGSTGLGSTGPGRTGPGSTGRGSRGQRRAGRGGSGHAGLGLAAPGGTGPGSTAPGGTGLRRAAAALDALHSEGLLIETGYRRYGMHDLIRQFAAERAAAIPVAERDQAARLLLDYYARAAAGAEAVLARHGRPARARPAAGAGAGADLPTSGQSEAGPGLPVAELPVADLPVAELPVAELPVADLRDPDRALAWVRAERGALLACVDRAAQAGDHARQVALTAGAAAVLRLDGPWSEAVRRNAAAAGAARRLGDPVAEADALYYVGDARRLIGELAEAAAAYESALRLYRDAGDRPGQASALRDLGAARMMSSDHAAAAPVLAEALDIFREIGSLAGQATTLTYLGDMRRLGGDFAAAGRSQEQALALYRAAGDRLGEASALNYLAVGYLETCDYPAATATLTESLRIYRDLGNRRGQANALGDLGIAALSTGDYPGALRVLDEALDIYRDIGSQHGYAGALNQLGVARRLSGDLPGAQRAQEEVLRVARQIGSRISEANALMELGAGRRAAGRLRPASQFLGEALQRYTEIGSVIGQAETLNEFGAVHLARSAPDRARDCYGRALAIARQTSIPSVEAAAVAGLARCARYDGDLTAAAAGLRDAQRIFARIGAPEAAAIAAELAAMGSPVEHEQDGVPAC